MRSRGFSDGVAREIEDFITKWRERAGFYAGYRRSIETRLMLPQREKVKEHSKGIRRKINYLRGFRGSKPILDSLVAIADKMLELGQEIESTFPRKMVSSELSKIEQSKLDSLISKGDNICIELINIELQLEKLR